MTTIVGTLQSALPRRWAFRQFGKLVHSIGIPLRAVRSAWSAFAEAGQLGPVEETSIGRHTGARI